jgi:hypothetical protein
MLKRLAMVSVLLCILCAPLFGGAASAAVGDACTDYKDKTGNDTSNGFLGFPKWYKYLPGEISADNICRPVAPKDASGDGNVALAIVPVGMAILEILFRVVGIIAFFMIIRAGFAYTTSQGNPQETKVAKDRIVNAFVGIAISLVATSAITFFYGEIIR